MAKDKELTLVTAKELADLTGINKDHLNNVKKLTRGERKQFHKWLADNLDLINDWTEIKPEHVRRAVELYQEPSVINFDADLLYHDHESWKEFKKNKLKTLENKLQWIYDLLDRSPLDSDCDDLPRQTMVAFAPPSFELDSGMDGIGKMLEAVKAARKYNGPQAAPRLPEWVEYLAGYLQYKDYEWENFEALMWVFGYRKNNEGEEKWDNMIGHEFDDLWDCPLTKMPRLHEFIRLYGLGSE